MKRHLKKVLLFLIATQSILLSTANQATSTVDRSLKSSKHATKSEKRAKIVKATKVDTSASNEVSLRLKDIDFERTYFIPIGQHEQICCCHDTQECFVQPEDTPCFCDETEGIIVAKNIPLANNEGLCIAQGSMFITSEGNCQNGVEIPVGAEELPTLIPDPAVETAQCTQRGGVCMWLPCCTSGCSECSTMVCDRPQGSTGVMSYCTCVSACHRDGCCDGVCFSSKSSVNVMGKGITPIREVKVEDYVQSKTDGTFSKVWGIHKNDNVRTSFRRILTDSETVLEVTPRHMIYLEGSDLPIPSKKVKVGDKIQVDPIHSANVTRIENIEREGFYNPLTEDGTIIVNGVKASLFSVSQGKTSSYYDKNQIIHWHSLTQLVVAPVRVTCKMFWSGFCTDKNLQDENGLHKYLTFLKGVRALPDMGQYVLLPIIVGTGVFFSAIEYLYDSVVGTRTISIAAVSVI